MQLDVVIPTYNRHEMLARTLGSLLAADVPEGLSLHVTVVDNNSRDRTRQTVEEWQEKFAGRLHYIFESQQGRSPALNAGIRATSGDWVGMIDDDEEVDQRWCVAAAEFLSREEVDFIGGPCLPNWGAERPAWFSMEYRGVIGWVPGVERVAMFGGDYPGQLMGGNAILKRALLQRVGLYATNLGRTAKGLLSCEDEDLHQRLLAAGARGFFVPSLIIYHHVPPERLTKSYFRRWSLWRGVSQGVIDKSRPKPVAYLAGVPRYMFGRAARGIVQRIKGALPGAGTDPARSFSGELACWDLAGFFYGKNFYRTAAGESGNDAETDAGASVKQSSPAASN